MIGWAMILETALKWAIPAICIAIVGVITARIIKPLKKQNRADRLAEWESFMQTSQLPQTLCMQHQEKFKQESDAKDQEILDTINNLVETIKTEHEETKAYRQTTEKQIELIQDGVRDVHLQNLIHTCERFIKRGYITPEEREIYNQRYNLYKSLGGNGHMDPWNNKMIALPSEPPKSNEYVATPAASTPKPPIRHK